MEYLKGVIYVCKLGHVKIANRTMIAKNKVLELKEISIRIIKKKPTLEKNF